MVKLKIKLNKNAIYRKALERWGKELQLNQAIQEMAELIKEITNHKRPQPSRYNNYTEIAEEIADVQIMLDQLGVIFNKEYPGFYALIGSSYNAKLIRLKEVLD